MNDAEFIAWAIEARIAEIKSRSRKTYEDFLRTLKNEPEAEIVFVCSKLQDWSIQAGDDTGKEVRNYDDEYAAETARRIVEGLQRTLYREIERLKS